MATEDAEVFYTISLDYDSPAYYDNGMIDLSREEAFKIYQDIKNKLDAEVEALAKEGEDGELPLLLSRGTFEEASIELLCDLNTNTVYAYITGEDQENGAGLSIEDLKSLCLWVEGNVK